MTRWVSRIFLIVMTGVVAGCLSGERKASQLTPDETVAAPEPSQPLEFAGPPRLSEVLPPEPLPPLKPVAPTGPALTSDPDTWVKGELFQVWPYANGEVAGYLGTRHGVYKGDLLVLSRDGTIINAILVLNVHRETFFGRVTDRAGDAVAPRVGDVALKGPQPLIVKPRPPMTVEEEAAGPAEKK